MPNEVVELALGFVVGLSLGLLGGGGSILTVPALVYLVGQSPQAAVTTSLAIVGANSTVGAMFHHRADHTSGRTSFNWKVALVFGGAGMIVSYLAAGLSKQLSSSLIMVLFALLMLLVGGLMILRGRAVTPGSAGEKIETPRFLVTLISGAGVGLLTGILGVGGGFLIVPAMVMLVGLPMTQAVGTSLAVIAANSFAGLAGHLGGPLDLWVTLLFVAAGTAGTFAGAKLAHRLPAERLRQIFAIFVIVLAIFLMADNLPRLLA